MASPAAAQVSAPTSGVLPLAVLGDSDSHSYQDRESFPPGTAKRGGALHGQTFQWTEVLARLRPRQVDLGAWESWGTSPWRAALLDLAGRPTRVPVKEDYRHNFAASGATCEDLFEGQHQATRLVNLMNQDPARWRGGLVVIRIGINSLGGQDKMDAYARDGLSARHQATVGRCLEPISRAVSLIRHDHAQTRIVLVGLLNNADWPPNFSRWQSAAELARISAVLDAFDHGLAALAQSDPLTAFFDDRANFRRRFGARDAQGQPAYTAAAIGRQRITNTQGDEPEHGVVADGHAGTATNALWVRDLIDFLNQHFASGIAAVTDEELARWLDTVQMPQR